MEPKQQPAVIVPASEGKVWHVLGQTITLKVSSEDTNGEYSVIEQVAPPQTGPPLHVHRSEDELLYVLEGEWHIQCGDQTFSAAKGAWATLPRNIPHTFKNLGTAPSKVLVVIIPGGFEGFFAEVSQLSTDGPPERTEILAIARKYDLEILPSS